METQTKKKATRNQPAPKGVPRPAHWKKPGPKRGVHYTSLQLEIARVSGLDRQIVRQVMEAIPQAVMNMFDRAERWLHIPGLCAFTYKILHAEPLSRNERSRRARWGLGIHSDRHFNKKLDTMLGNPPALRFQHYRVSVDKRRDTLRGRWAELGIEAPKWDDSQHEVFPD